MKAVIGRASGGGGGDMEFEDCNSIQPRERESCTPARHRILHFAAVVPKNPHELVFKTGPPAPARRRGATMTEPGSLAMSEHERLLRL
ncbi:MAG TPA: hypothetical protein VII31_06475, partial [Caldimonas sp.]